MDHVILVHLCLIKHRDHHFFMIVTSLLFNFRYYAFRHLFFVLGLTSELETLKIVTELTDSQIFTFVVDIQSKQKSEKIQMFGSDPKKSG